MEQLDIKSQTLPELKKTMEELSEKPFRAKQIYEWIHKKQADSFREMTNLSVSLREKLERNATLVSLKVLDVQTSRLDARKQCLYFFSGRMPDGLPVLCLCYRRMDQEPSSFGDAGSGL